MTDPVVEALQARVDALYAMTEQHDPLPPSQRERTGLELAGAHGLRWIPTTPARWLRGFAALVALALIVLGGWQVGVLILIGLAVELGMDVRDVRAEWRRLCDEAEVQHAAWLHGDDDIAILGRFQPNATHTSSRVALEVKRALRR